MDIIAIQEKETTLWHIVKDREVLRLISTTKLDAHRMSSVELSKMISLQLIDKLPKILSSLTIYSTDNSPRSHYILEEALVQHFDCNIAIKRHHQSVAEALCVGHAGLIAEIGVSSEMWTFDGARVTAYTPSLGYIFGDRGSSTVLGKMFISALLTRQISVQVAEAFYTRFGVDAEWLLYQVQNNQLPKKFLSSLLPFIADHREETSVKTLIYQSLEDHLSQDILPHAKDKEVHFLGEMTTFYGEALPTICQRLGIRIGKVLTSATDTLLSSHTSVHK